MKNFLKAPVYQLYLFQAENYEAVRFLRLLFRKGFFVSRETLRKKIMWTAKALLIAGIAVMAVIVLVVGSVIKGGLVWGVIAGAVSFMAIPFIYIFAVIVLSPVDLLLKKILFLRAKRIMALGGAKVIGIAGSYGKTTMKAMLSAVLSQKYKTAATPESVNTPVGIARWVIAHADKKPEIFIIEMGEHYRGDVKYLASLASPDIAVITGINEAHIERMGSVHNITATIFEIAENFKDGAVAVLNADDTNIISNYERFIKNGNTFFYSSRDHEKAHLKSINRHFDADKASWVAEFENNYRLTIPLLGEYAIGSAMAAIIIGRRLGMSDDEIKSGIMNMTPVPHRLQLIKSPGDVLVIDDSYNGNADGVSEAIRTLGRFNDRRKIFITPGIVETGKFVSDIHRKIGKELAGVADMVILIKNSATSYIEEGLLSEGFEKDNIKWFKTAPEAHEALPSIVKSGDVVLFQNDWGDQYL